MLYDFDAFDYDHIYEIPTGVVEPGWYQVKVVDYEADTIKKQDSNYFGHIRFNLTFEVLGGMYAGQILSGTHMLVPSPEGIGRLYRQFIVAQPDNDLSDPNELEKIPYMMRPEHAAYFKDRQVRALVDTDMYEGNELNRIKRYIKAK